MKIVIKLFFLQLFFLKIIYSASVTLGSDTTSGAAIAYTQLDGAENKIANYGLMNNGFSLRDSATTCSFDSVYQASGGFFPIGGKVFLNRDFNLAGNHIFVGGGQFYGNNNALFLNNSDTTEEFLPGRVGPLYEIANYTTGDDVYSISWTYDDRYIAAGRDSGTGNNLRILGFDGSSLNLLSSLLFANDVNTVAWHPSQYYLAIGIQAAITGFEVRIYSWNGTTLSQTSGAEIGTGVRAVAWSRDGNYLAISQSNDYVRVYSFSAGTITLQASLLLTGFGTAARDAISWDSTGQYIVVGDGSTATNSLRVLYYNGATSLTQNVAVSPGSVIQTVDWRPNSDLIAVGLSATTERLRLYRFASGSLTDVTSAYVGEIYTIYSVNWSNNGNYLVSGRDDQAGNDLKTYYFNSYNNQLLLLAGFEVPSDVYCAKWAHGENYLATGDQGDYVRVYGITKRDLDFYDTDLILNSDLNIKMTANFFNSCSINGNGNRINLDTSGIINIGAGSSLTIKNAEIYGLSKQNLKCLSDNSSLIVQNCVLTLTSNYLFDQGSILFDKDVIISGTNFFTYASRQTSTINSDSRLYLSQNLTFSYAPKRNNKDLIYMTDVSSGLYLDGTTLLSTNTGLRLSAGSLFLDNKVTISALGIALSESIVFNSDLTLNILASANLDLYGPIEI